MRISSSVPAWRFPDNVFEHDPLFIPPTYPKHFRSSLHSGPFSVNEIIADPGRFICFPPTSITFEMWIGLPSWWSCLPICIDGLVCLDTMFTPSTMTLILSARTCKTLPILPLASPPQSLLLYHLTFYLHKSSSFYSTLRSQRNHFHVFFFAQFAGYGTKNSWFLFGEFCLHGLTRLRCHQIWCRNRLFFWRRFSSEQSPLLQSLLFSRRCLERLLSPWRRWHLQCAHNDGRCPQVPWWSKVLWLRNYRRLFNLLSCCIIRISSFGRWWRAQGSPQVGNALVSLDRKAWFPLSWRYRRLWLRCVRHEPQIFLWS